MRRVDCSFIVAAIVTLTGSAMASGPPNSKALNQRFLEVMNKGLPIEIEKKAGTLTLIKSGEKKHNPCLSVIALTTTDKTDAAAVGLNWETLPPVSKLENAGKVTGFEVSTLKVTFSDPAKASAAYAAASGLQMACNKARQAHTFLVSTSESDMTTFNVGRSDRTVRGDLVRIRSVSPDGLCKLELHNFELKRRVLIDFQNAVEVRSWDSNDGTAVWIGGPFEITDRDLEEKGRAAIIDPGGTEMMSRVMRAADYLRGMCNPADPDGF